MSTPGSTAAPTDAHAQSRVAPGGATRAWVLAARPKTLPAAVTPVVVGAALAAAGGVFVPWVAAACFIVALLLQIAANFANDVFDFHQGADTTARLGPTRVTLSGLLAPRQVLRATWLTLGAAAAVGALLVWRGGWPILLLGLLALISAVAYTAGPAPLGYLGLGELFVFLFFGPVAVTGTYYLQAGHLTGLALALGIPVGGPVTAILVVNNLRDVETDRVAGKRTLAVRCGRAATLVEYAALLAIAYLALPLLWFVGYLPPWWWLPWLSLPLAALLLRDIRVHTGIRLNRVLAGTARLHLVYGLLLALALVL